jgi:hypothetical protein
MKLLINVKIINLIIQGIMINNYSFSYNDDIKITNLI